MRTALQKQDRIIGVKLVVEVVNDQPFSDDIKQVMLLGIEFGERYIRGLRGGPVADDFDLAYEGKAFHVAFEERGTADGHFVARNGQWMCAGLWIVEEKSPVFV